jgi:phosphatidylinositol alpha-1,6-mannosyltransferase
LTTIKIIANTKGKKNFIPFVLGIFARLPFILHKYDVVLFGDGTLSPVGEFFKFFYSHKKFVSVIHALDITFAQKKSLLAKIYKFLNIPALKSLDKLIMVGNHAIDEAVRMGINREKCVFIPNGVNIKKVKESHTKDELEKLLSDTTGKDVKFYKNKKVLLRVGRFVPHKGLHWFIDKVMPLLPEDYILIGAGGYNPRAVGDSENYTLCQKYIKKHHLEDRIILFPNIPQPQMNILFNTADIYITPNIYVKGSAEGFGLNALEAVICGRIVLSANLQGLKDAIADNVNGFMLEPENPKVWKNKVLEISNPDFDKNTFVKNAKQYTLQNFTWDKIGQKYLEILQSIE